MLVTTITWWLCWPPLWVMHSGTDLLCLMCVRYLVVLGSALIIKPSSLFVKVLRPPIPYTWLAMYGRLAGLGFAFKH